MKHLKTLGLAIVAAAALMAFVGAGTASATVICKTNTSPCTEKYPAGTEYKASLKSGTSMLLTTTEGTVLDTCTGGALVGKTENTGSATETVRGPVPASGLTWSGCTFATVTLKGGVTETHAISGTANGTYTAKEFEITVNTGLFGSCSYSAGGGIDIGVVTGGAPATVDINAVVARTSGLCPATAKWTATYTVTSPNPLYVKES